MKHRILLALLFVVAPVAAHAQLLDDRMDGIRRVCVYAGETRDPRSALTNDAMDNDRRRGRQDRRTITVGAWENCPQQFPIEREQDVLDGPPPPPPPFAMLRDQRLAVDHRECIYSYLGQDYTRVVPSNAVCTLTPN